MTKEQLLAIVNNPAANTNSPYYKDAVDQLLRLNYANQLQQSVPPTQPADEV